MSTVFKGDPLVNHALDIKLKRERAWVKKHSSVVEAEKLVEELQVHEIDPIINYMIDNDQVNFLMYGEP